MKTRIVVGISGASGAALGIRVIEILSEDAGCELHLVVTPGGERTLRHEIGPDALDQLDRLVCQRHPIDDVGASIASGSFRIDGIIVAPCSIHTLTAIATSAADNLLIRAADVSLKERRRLVLLVRETPLHLGHLRAMAAATEYGAIIAPPVPAFYLRPRSVDEIVDQLARRAIALLDIKISRPGTEWMGLSNGGTISSKCPRPTER
ncbi:UbiX family flavin prenyltransferase [Bauldia litoralis]|uniref:UbiX family flavin prenyltransferase n=1 Tax=Bauldia litoralis TaxID=665467 RepID=UPI003265D60C